MRRRLVLAACLLAGVVAAPVRADGPLAFSPAGNELYPPRLDRLLRAYEQPPTPWAAGHRGVDVAVEAGETILLAPISGRASTGLTPGNRYLTIDRGDGRLKVTLSYLSGVLVATGWGVFAGEEVAIAGTGHEDGTPPEPHVHVSVRVPDLTDPSGWRYVDPMPYLRRYLRRVRMPVTRLEPP